MPQLQLGGTLGRHAYWRAQVGKGNPLYYRDTNVLAGDNGTRPEGTLTPSPAYDTGFPIFYDAKMDDLDTHGQLEWGAGLGFAARDGRSPRAAWRGPPRLVLPPPAGRLRRAARHVRPRRPRAAARQRAIPLPFEGRDKSEVGAQRRRPLRPVAARRADRAPGHRRRSCARGSTPRLRCHLALPGLFLVGETPVGNWIRPVLRVSIIDNLFDAPVTYPALSVDWDWKKYDIGVRFGIVRDVDLTVEYLAPRHDRAHGGRTLHPDEFLVTLRVGFAAYARRAGRATRHAAPLGLASRAWRPRRPPPRENRKPCASGQPRS